MKYLSCGLGVIQEAGKYTCATVEYTGLLSYGMLKLGGRVVASSFLRVTTPVAKGMARPFVGMTNVTRRLFGRRAYLDDKFKSVEDRLAGIAEKLASLESRGVVLRETTIVTAPVRQIDMGRQALLRQIVEANKSLMDQEEEKG